MNAEITKIAELAELHGWLLYDGECPLCAAWAMRCERLLTRRGFDLAPLQSNWVRECLDLADEPPFTEMRVVTPGGAQFGGADAVVYLARFIWWTWPLVPLAAVPGMMPLLRAAYRWLAARRHCFGGRCTIELQPETSVSKPRTP